MAVQSFPSMTLAEFLGKTAAKEPTPGGGAIAAACGALGAALARMVVAYSVGKKNLEEHQDLLASAATQLDRGRAMLLELAEEDARAYGLVSELTKLPEGDPRRARLGEAQSACVQAPLAVAGTCVDLLRLMQKLAGKSNTNLRSDLAIAAVLAEAAVRASVWNVTINLAQVAKESERAKVKGLVEGFARSAREACARIEAACAV